MTRFFHSRYFVVLAALMAAAGICIYSPTSFEYPQTDDGIVATWGLQGLLQGWTSIGIAYLINILVAAVLCYLNSAFNVLRGMTMLQGSLFLIFELATPSLLFFFAPGILISLVLMACFILMFASYADHYAQRKVFLSFLLLSAGCSIDYGFVVYMPVIWFALFQLRIFSLRTFLASLLGIITPWIIFLGFGLASLSELRLPQIVQTSWPDYLTSQWFMLGTAAFTAFLGVCAWAQNLIKTMTYNAQSRARINIVTAAMFATFIAVLINYDHIGAFLPVINCCVALQLAHLFGVIHRKPKSAWWLLSITLIYLCIFLCRVAISIL